MAKFYENLKANRSVIEQKITHGIPEMAKLMAEREMITDEEKFLIISKKHGRVRDLLDIVEKKYCHKMFIRILRENRLDDCAELIKGDAELSSDEEDERENHSSDEEDERENHSSDEEDELEIHSSEEEDIRENRSSYEPVKPIWHMYSSRERVAETINIQLRSDLKKAGEKITHLETENGKLLRQKLALQCRINELQTSLNCLQSEDTMFREQSRELNETKNKLKLVEKKLTEIESKDSVKENARLSKELTETKEQVISLAADMKKRDIKMDETLADFNCKLDILVHHLVPVPKTDITRRASVTLSNKKPVPITETTSVPTTVKTSNPTTVRTANPTRVRTANSTTVRTSNPTTARTSNPTTVRTHYPTTGRTSVPPTVRTIYSTTGRTSVPTNERNSRPKTGTSPAQAVLPPINTDTKT